MDLPKTINNFHHAYIVTGSNGDLVRTALEKRGIHITGNPDVTIIKKQSFGIDDARALRTRARLKPTSGDHTFFIIETTSITREAQNALLKTFEEPLGGAIFFLIVPNISTILPTLQSRAYILTTKQNEGRSTSLIDIDMFLGASQGERIKMLEPLLSKDKNEERDVRSISELLDSLEREMVNRYTKQYSVQYRDGIEAVYRAKKYSTDKGASLKILLEQVALLTPEI